MNKSVNFATNYSDDEGNHVDFLSDELTTFQNEMKLTTSQLAQKIIAILRKLVRIEKEIALTQTDDHSVTMTCLRFSFDTISFLNGQKVFSESDQTVIKINLLELMFLCFNNLVDRDGKSIEPLYNDLFNLLETSDSNEMSCGLILNILTILSNLCMKQSTQKTENLNMFMLSNHLILTRLKMLSRDRQLFHIVQKQLIRIIRRLRVAEKLKCDKRKPKRKLKLVNHCDENADACIFENLLIDSFIFNRSSAQLLYILNFLRAKGICCCNGSIETIRIFMRPSFFSIQCLAFIEERILRPAFERKETCRTCNSKLQSAFFQSEYFALLRNEIQRRQGSELYSLLHHLTVIQKMFSSGILREFVMKVIAPTFEREKTLLLADVEKFSESKAVVVTCTSILNDSMREDSIVPRFFNIRSINHLKDCSLMPSCASSVCQLLKHALDKGKLIVGNQREETIKLINSTLFANVLYLTRELMFIYEQIDLPKTVPLSDSYSSSERALADTSDFEILDEQTVAVKEALSDMDILLLNTVHWNILCDLIINDPAFQQDFIANIYNNFSGNILFTIAYNALSTIVMRKELKKDRYQLSFAAPVPRMSSDELPVIFERCSYRTPVIASKYDASYQQIVQRRYHLHEIQRSFLERLIRQGQRVSTYRMHGDNDATFCTVQHKDFFLPDNVTENSSRQQQIAGDKTFWFRDMWLGSFEAKTIRDYLARMVGQFRQNQEELRVRTSIINEITGEGGVRCLSSIARNCFDICWRLSDTISFSKLTFQYKIFDYRSLKKKIVQPTAHLVLRLLRCLPHSVEQRLQKIRFAQQRSLPSASAQPLPYSDGRLRRESFPTT